MAKNCHAFTAMERPQETKINKNPNQQKPKPQTGTYQCELCQKLLVSFPSLLALRRQN